MQGIYNEWQKYSSYKCSIWYIEMYVLITTPTTLKNFSVESLTPPIQYCTTEKAIGCELWRQELVVMAVDVYCCRRGGGGG